MVSDSKSTILMALISGRMFGVSLPYTGLYSRGKQQYGSRCNAS